MDFTCIFLKGHWLFVFLKQNLKKKMDCSDLQNEFEVTFNKLKEKPFKAKGL